MTLSGLEKLPNAELRGAGFSRDASRLSDSGWQAKRNYGVMMAESNNRELRAVRIYALCDPVTNAPRYVGKTSNRYCNG